jgi:hypothetical protein
MFFKIRHSNIILASLQEFLLHLKYQTQNKKCFHFNPSIFINVIFTPLYNKLQRQFYNINFLIVTGTSITKSLIPLDNIEKLTYRNLPINCDPLLCVITLKTSPYITPCLCTFNYKISNMKVSRSNKQRKQRKFWNLATDIWFYTNRKYLFLYKKFVFFLLPDSQKTKSICKQVT